MVETKKHLWFENGLRFKCTGCGGCCTGAPGYVWLSDEDIDRLRARLGIERAEFLSTYCIKIKGSYSLRDIAPSYDCVFLEDGKACTVYEDRPEQCKTYPWWPDVMRSEKTWNMERRHCEGIDHPDGTLYYPKDMPEDVQ